MTRWWPLARSLACAWAAVAALGISGCGGDGADDEPVDAANEELASGGELPAFGMNYGAVTYGLGPLGPLTAHFEKLAGADMAYARLWFDLAGNDPTAFDAPITDAVSHGALVLPILFTGTAAGTLGVDDVPTWRAEVNAIAVRFGPKTKTSGTFWKLHPELPYRPVRVWEIWNEENSTGFWTDGNPDGYYQALKAAHEGLRAADPRARVVMGGLIYNTSTNFKYLETILGKPGGKCLFDALAVHPYSKDAGTSITLVKMAHDELVRQHLADVPLWITEVGWAVDGTWPGKRAGFTTPNAQVQAQYLAAFARAAAAHRDDYNIGPTFWFNYQDIGGAYGDGWGLHAGLLTADETTEVPGTPRPSFGALARIAHEHPRAALPPLRCPK